MCTCLECHPGQLHYPSIYLSYPQFTWHLAQDFTIHVPLDTILLDCFYVEECGSRPFAENSLYFAFQVLLILPYNWPRPAMDCPQICNYYCRLQMDVLFQKSIPFIDTLSHIAMLPLMWAVSTTLSWCLAVYMSLWPKLWNDIVALQVMCFIQYILDNCFCFYFYFISFVSILGFVFIHIK